MNDYSTKKLLTESCDITTEANIFNTILISIKDDYDKLDQIIASLIKSNMNVSPMFKQLDELVNLSIALKEKAVTYATISNPNRHLIEDLPLSTRSKTILNRYFSTNFNISVVAIEDLSLVTYKQLESSRNAGKKSLQEIVDMMKQYNVNFKE